MRPDLAITAISGFIVMPFLREGARGARPCPLPQTPSPNPLCFWLVKSGPRPRLNQPHTGLGGGCGGGQGLPSWPPPLISCQNIPVIPHLRLIAALADQGFDFGPRQAEATPVAATTFSSSMVEPKSSAPEFQGHLGHLGSLGHPGDLQVGHVVQDQAGDGQGFQILHRAQGLALEVGAPGLVGPGDERGEARGFVLESAKSGRDGSTRSARVSRWPNIMVALVGEALAWAAAITPATGSWSIFGRICCPHPVPPGSRPRPRDGVQTRGHQTADQTLRT